MTPQRGTLAHAVVVGGQSIGHSTGTVANARGRAIINSVLQHVPSSFSTLVAGREPEPYISGDEWLTRLPALVQESLAQWDLAPDGDSLHGMTALVLPVRRGDGSPAVLKVTWPHIAARHEHLALQHWAGRGAVRLLAANPVRWTMLLERLDPGRNLSDVPIDEACAVIGNLLQQLDHPALPALSRLSADAADLVQRLGSAPAAIPRRFVQQARTLLSELVTDGGVDSRMVNTDLHFGNVLAAERQRWLAIDPKPLAADPAFAVAPALWNRLGRSRCRRRRAATPATPPVDHL
jgi:streptomycin 6-kinase